MSAERSPLMCLLLAALWLPQWTLRDVARWMNEYPNGSTPMVGEPCDWQHVATLGPVRVYEIHCVTVVVDPLPVSMLADVLVGPK